MTVCNEGVLIRTKEDITFDISEKQRHRIGHIIREKTSTNNYT